MTAIAAALGPEDQPPKRKPYLTPQDVADINAADALVNGVIERHGTEMTIGTNATFSHGIQSLHLALHRMEGGW